MILTCEGILVIRDDLLPGESVDGYKAGPLWSSPRASLAEELGGGENCWNFKGGCFTSADPEDENAYAADLLVCYGKAQGQRCGAKRVGKNARRFATAAKGWLVTYSCETLKAGKPVTFLTVLAPHPRDVSGEALANAIQSTVEDGEVTVSLTHKGESVNMTFGKENGDWSVVRKSSR